MMKFYIIFFMQFNDDMKNKIKNEKLIKPPSHGTVSHVLRTKEEKKRGSKLLLIMQSESQSPVQSGPYKCP